MARHNHGRNGGGRPRRRGWDDGERYEPDARARRDKRNRDRAPERAPDPPLPVQPVRLAPEPAAAARRTCGDCREWFPHEEGGRGDCGHPGSGFSFPWSDTPACPFFARRR